MRQWGLANLPLDPLLVCEAVIRNPQTCSFSLLRPSRHYSQLRVSACEGGLIRSEPQQTVPDVMCVCVHSRWWSACVFIGLSSLRVIMALRWCYILKTRPPNLLSLKRLLVWWCGNNHIRASVTCLQSHIWSKLHFHCYCYGGLLWNLYNPKSREVGMFCKNTIK